MRIARKAHPNVFELVDIFKQEQFEQRSQLTRTRKLENYRFSQDQISLEEYVRRISACTAILTYFYFFFFFFFYNPLYFMNLYNLFQLFHIVLVTFCTSRRNDAER